MTISGDAPHIPNPIKCVGVVTSQESPYSHMYPNTEQHSESRLVFDLNNLSHQLRVLATHLVDPLDPQTPRRTDEQEYLNPKPDSCHPTEGITPDIVIDLPG
jgi:hypothetical protein